MINRIKDKSIKLMEETDTFIYSDIQAIKYTNEFDLERELEELNKMTKSTKVLCSIRYSAFLKIAGICIGNCNRLTWNLYCSRRYNLGLLYCHVCRG